MKHKKITLQFVGPTRIIDKPPRYCIFGTGSSYDTQSDRTLAFAGSVALVTYDDSGITGVIMVLDLKQLDYMENRCDYLDEVYNVSLQILSYLPIQPHNVTPLRIDDTMTDAHVRVRFSRKKPSAVLLYPNERLREILGD